MGQVDLAEAVPVKAGQAEPRRVAMAAPALAEPADQAASAPAQTVNNRTGGSSPRLDRSRG